MENINFYKMKMLFIAFLIMTNSGLLAQNNSSNNSNGLWYSSGSDTVLTNRNVLINNSLKVNNNILVDTLKSQILKIGSNSLWLGINDFITGSNNNIFADNGDLRLQSLGFNFNTIINANNTGRVGIGTDNPNNKLHIEDANNVFAQFTTSAFANGAMIGLNNAGEMEINQQEDQPITIWENGLERMRITNTVSPMNSNFTNLNRIGIGEFGNVNPMTLVHYGFNLPGIPLDQTGWRDWMDVVINRG